jgi:hypothetical protein
VASHELVQPVEERRGAERSQRGAQRPGQAELEEQRDAASAVAGNEGAIAEDEPPTLVPRLLGNRCEQRVGLVICERKQRKLFVPVDPGDDTRRPAAELSTAGVEENRARNARDRRRAGAPVLCHADSVRRKRAGDQDT